MISYRKWMACGASFLFLCSVGCGADTAENDSDVIDSTPVSEEIFAMDTYMTLTAYGENASPAIEAAIDYIEDLDAMLSTEQETSEISQLNTTGTYTLSEDAAEILSAAIEASALTEGAFDPSVYPIMQAWGFPTQEFCVPSEETLQLLLPLVDYTKIEFDSATREATLPDGMKIDLGGIVKGYVAEKVAEIFTEYDVKSGIASLGGDVQTLGEKPDGSLWRVAIQNPDSSGDYLGILEVGEIAVVTSGDYERYFEEDGVLYHHIVDPDTGCPAQTGLHSVTVVSEDGTMADALSTALFVMGIEDASDFWRENSDLFDAIFLTDDGTIYVTEGLEDTFSSDLFPWEIIPKESEA